MGIRFSYRLKIAMDQKGMTQTELSEKTGIGKSAISQYLSGKHEAREGKINSLAKALDVNPAWLMGYDVAKSNFCKPDLLGFDDVLSYHWVGPLANAYKNQIPQIQKAVCDVLGIQYIDPIQSAEDSARFEEVLTHYLSIDEDGL